MKKSQFMLIFCHLIEENVFQWNNAKTLRKAPAKNKFRIILNDKPKNAKLNVAKKKESEKFTNLVKRFKDLVKDQKLEIEQERLAKLPKTWNRWKGLFTNINMAFKMVKCDHDICVEWMTSYALTQEENKNSWSLVWPICPKDKNTKLKISHSQLNEVQDPQNFILSKIVARKYQEYVYRDIDLVDHNIWHFKELVIREDNVIMNQRGSKLTFCPGCKLEYEFNNPPYILSCCHRLCRNWISQYYKENSDTIIIPCGIDDFSNQYVKPKALLQDQENAEQFNNFNSFLEIVLQIDYELFDEIFNANNDFENEDLIIREVYIQGEGKFAERMKSNSIISNNVNIAVFLVAFTFSRLVTMEQCNNWKALNSMKNSGLVAKSHKLSFFLQC